MQDTDVHASGMQIAITVKSMLVGVEVHEVSSFLGNLLFHCQHTTVVCREETSIIIKALELTPYSLRSFLASAFERGSPEVLGDVHAHFDS